MSTVIYLSGLQVQIVEGTGSGKNINIKRCTMEDAPEGSIINGIVMDEESFVDFIRDLKNKRVIQTKEVYLVINSTKFVGRTIEIPVMSDKKTLGYLSREYNDSGIDSESLFGYICLNQKNKFKKLYAEAIDPDFIKGYIDIFEKAGIKLKGIYSGESSIIEFAGISVSSHVKTFQLVVADGNSLTNLVFANGSFYYYNAVRCFHDQGTAEYADDIARSVSQITQFMKSNQLEAYLEKIFISGVDDSFIPVCAEAISSVGVGAKVEAFNFKSGGKVEKSYQNYIRSAAGFIANDKFCNYYTRYNSFEKDKKSKESEGQRTTFILIGTALLVMILILIGTMIYRNGKQKELDNIKDYNESPQMLFDVGMYNSFLERNNFLTMQRESIVGLTENLKTYPRGNTKVLKTFDKCAEGYALVSYNSFNANEGSISITASSEDVESIHKFIQRLMAEKIFEAVNYSGYHFNSNSNMWDIDVTCILAPSAGLKKIDNK